MTQTVVPALPHHPLAQSHRCGTPRADLSADSLTHCVPMYSWPPRTTSPPIITTTLRTVASRPQQLRECGCGAGLAQIRRAVSAQRAARRHDKAAGRRARARSLSLSLSLSLARAHGCTVLHAWRFNRGQPGLRLQQK
jgi:hypothetical protein